MPLSIDEAAVANAASAEQKARAYRDLPRSLISAALAGAFVGVAVVLLFSVSAPLAAANHPMTKLVQGSVFGIALTLVVFAGAELFTGNTMVMAQGLFARRVRARDVGLVWAVSLIGNVLGSIGLAVATYAAGTASGPFGDLVAKTVASKNSLSDGQLFWRAVLCNALVCLALWMAARASSDGAKLAVLWWALLAFIGSGFEHSVANVTTFALGALHGTSTWGDLVHNLAWTVPGNIVGGAVVVGLVYAWLGKLRPTAVADVMQVTATVAAPVTVDQLAPAAVEVASR
jgi:nitrite transporter NirC